MANIPDPEPNVKALTVEEEVIPIYPPTRFRVPVSQLIPEEIFIFISGSSGSAPVPKKLSVPVPEKVNGVYAPCSKVISSPLNNNSSFP